MVTPENARSYAVLVKQHTQNGEISAVGRPILQRQQIQLKLTSTEAQAIERRVLQLLAQAETHSPVDHPSLLAQAALDTDQSIPAQPSLLAKTDQLESPSDDQGVEARGMQHEDSVASYEEEFLQAIQLEFPPGELLRRGLKLAQENLELTDERVEAIESRVGQRFQAQQAQYQDYLRQYEQAFSQAVARGVPFREATWDQLAELQHSLGLPEKDTTSIEGRLLAEYLAQPRLTQQTGLPELFPELADVSDAPPTQIFAPEAFDSATAPTAQPAELSSFISAKEMPPGEAFSEQQSAQQILTLAQSVEAEPVSLRSEKEWTMPPCLICCDSKNGKMLIAKL
ncbi:MAG: hypothetical protein HC772_12400 [Leptolyngbyaceae cyanobacterium CRU_2_3]|nr:hypothetical protein [Leptolyngbyaceae cyanobacterium CRU_2_3]